jgi:parvulin-like peptidyl-prolyl isomerase
MKMIQTLLAASVLSTSVLATTLATVNTEPVTMKDIQIVLKSDPNKNSYSELNNTERKMVLNQAIQTKLIKQKALDEGIKKTAMYQEAMKQIEEKLLVEVWMKQQFENIQITQEQIKAYYKKNQTSFNQAFQIKARHIVLKTQKQAQKLIHELENAKGDIQKQFIALAKKHSIGPSASKGGDLGWFKEGVMLDSFWQEAKSLEENEYSSKPIKTKFGYHIIYVDGKQQAYTIPLEQMVQTIKNKLKMELFQKNIATKINGLRKSAEIIIQ